MCTRPPSLWPLTTPHRRQRAAQAMMERMRQEDGNRGTVDHFHRVLYAGEVVGSSAVAPTIARLAGGRFAARVRAGLGWRPGLLWAKAAGT